MPSVDGVVSGLDTTGLIQAIVTARQVSIDTLKSHQAAFEKQREAVAGIKNRMSALSTAIGDIDTGAKLRAFQASTSSTAFSVTAENGATPGTFGLRVHELARAETSSSQGYADKTSAVVGTGTFQVTVGGVTSDVTIDASHQSLQGLAEKLNEVSGVDAYVIDTGSPTDRFRLMVTGTSTGAANAIDVDFSGVGGGPTLTEQTTAVDARIEIAGVTIFSASNTLNGAIPGVRIELKSTNTTAEDFSVSMDSSATKDRFQKVIDAFNDVVSYYATQTVYDTEKDFHGALVAEGTTRRAVDDIGRLASSRYTVAGTTLGGLSELGVSTQRDGSLELDATVFEEKFAADPDAVEAFLTSTTGPLAKLRSQIDDVFVDTDNGTLVNRGESLDSTISDLEERIGIAEDRLSAESARLRAQFTAMESVLAQIQSTSSSLSSMFAGMSSTSQK